jgi:hypothetical protein
LQEVLKYNLKIGSDYSLPHSFWSIMHNCLAV